MTSEVVQSREWHNDGVAVLFPGGTPAEVIAAATAAADTLTEVIRRKRLSMTIGGREHVLVEGWQTLGTLVGVFAVKDAGVTELPWPELGPIPQEPPAPGDEPRSKNTAEWRAWKDADELRTTWRQSVRLHTARDMGLAYGYTASFHAVKDGRPVGWGEGRCDRGEANWTMRDNYALSSMAQTRAQSRGLAAPLRFVVKLAGYEPTPAEEMTADVIVTVDREPDYLDADGEAKLIRVLQRQWSGIDAHGFLLETMRALETHGVERGAARWLQEWAKWQTQPQATGNVRDTPPAEPAPPTTREWRAPPRTEYDALKQQPDAPNEPGSAPN